MRDLPSDVLPSVRRGLYDHSQLDLGPWQPSAALPALWRINRPPTRVLSLRGAVDAGRFLVVLRLWAQILFIVPNPAKTELALSDGAVLRFLRRLPAYLAGGVVIGRLLSVLFINHPRTA